MHRNAQHRNLSRIGVLAALLLGLLPAAAWAYIDFPYPLGRIVTESTHIMVLRVEKVDRTANVITYRKVKDLKGTHPTDVLVHNIGQGGLHPREWQNIMAWADSGKTAVFFHNGASGELCLDRYWYQVSAGAAWNLVHAEPMFLPGYAGRPEKLIPAVMGILEGREVVVPCMSPADPNALHLRNGRILRLKASLRIQDFNQQRDFVGWGDEEFQRIAGMRGFSHFFMLNSVGAGPSGVAVTDLTGDGKPDFCLYGETRVAILKNADAVFNEAPLPYDGGARSAEWGDFDQDGKPDLLLATASGLRLFRNDGDKFIDLSAGLPRAAYSHVMAAAWIDFDGDKSPDILLADGFSGLRLYRNKKTPATSGSLKMGPWHLAGPFDNSEGKGFATAYPPEKEVDLSAEYAGKNNEKVAWKKREFVDGQVNTLRVFKPEHNENVAAYLYRELEVPSATELPVSLGSDDTLSVWLNGEPLAAENVARGCAPDQLLLTLALKPGKNTLLLKICQGGGEFGFYFAAREAKNIIPLLFEDVSDAAGLGVDGAGGRLKGDHLAVTDVNKDGRPDLLYSAGNGLLVINTGKRFVEAKDAGISYRAGAVRPVFGDFTGDGAPDLFVPQSGRSRLFVNDGKGRFTDQTAKAGALADPMGEAVCAVWTDFDRRGRLDLLVGCLRGPNRYFRNNGNGTFSDATTEIGFHQQIYNTCGMAATDVNDDRILDVVLANWGQGSVVLLGNPSRLLPYKEKNP
jgi:hypothetical protein